MKISKDHPVIRDSLTLRYYMTLYNNLLRPLTISIVNGGGAKALGKLVHLEEKTLVIGLEKATPNWKPPGKKNRILISFQCEGKEFYFETAATGHGKWDKRPALKINPPQELIVHDDQKLTHLYVKPKRPISFTTITNQVCEGEIVNFGKNGIDIQTVPPQNRNKMLKPGKTTVLGFHLSKNLEIACTGIVRYFTNTDSEILTGIEFMDLDGQAKHKYEAWLAAQEHKTRQERAQYVGARVEKQVAPPLPADKGPSSPSPLAPSAGRARGAAGMSAPSPTKQAAPTPSRLNIENDHDPVVIAGEPYILILCHSEELLDKMTDALKDEYGILRSKGRYANVVQILNEFNPILVLSHCRLGPISGFDICKTLFGKYGEAFPIVIMGESRNEAAQRTKAMLHEAQDYLTVEPFNQDFFTQQVQRFIEDFKEDHGTL